MGMYIVFQCLKCEMQVSLPWDGAFVRVKWHCKSPMRVGCRVREEPDERRDPEPPTCIHGKDGEGEDCHHVSCLKHRQAPLGST